MHGTKTNISQVEDENHDDIDVPSSAIVSDALGVAVVRSIDMLGIVFHAQERICIIMDL